MNSSTFFILFIPILAFILLGVNIIFAPNHPYLEKESIFECGYHSFLGQNRIQFAITFFVFALLFLLFDLEILLIYPYAVSAYTNDIYGLIIMVIFLLVLTIGFVFEIGKNALKIDSRQMLVLFDYNNSLARTQSELFGFKTKLMWLLKSKAFSTLLIIYIVKTIAYYILGSETTILIGNYLNISNLIDTQVWITKQYISCTISFIMGIVFIFKPIYSIFDMFVHIIFGQNGAKEYLDNTSINSPKARINLDKIKNSPLNKLGDSEEPEGSSDQPDKSKESESGLNKSKEIAIDSKETANTPAKGKGKEISIDSEEDKNKAIDSESENKSKDWDYKEYASGFGGSDFADDFYLAIEASKKDMQKNTHLSDEQGSSSKEVNKNVSFYDSDEENFVRDSKSTIKYLIKRSNATDDPLEKTRIWLEMKNIQQGIMDNSKRLDILPDYINEYNRLRDEHATRVFETLMENISKDKNESNTVVENNPKSLEDHNKIIAEAKEALAKFKIKAEKLNSEAEDQLASALRLFEWGTSEDQIDANNMLQDSEQSREYARNAEKEVDKAKQKVESATKSLTAFLNEHKKTGKSPILSALEANKLKSIEEIPKTNLNTSTPSPQESEDLYSASPPRAPVSQPVKPSGEQLTDVKDSSIPYRPSQSTQAEASSSESPKNNENNAKRSKEDDKSDSETKRPRK